MKKERAVIYPSGPAAVSVLRGAGYQFDSYSGGWYHPTQGRVAYCVADASGKVVVQQWVC